MPLLAFNITGFTVTLAAGSPAPVLPASLAPPGRGPAVDVTKELQGLHNPAYALLETQRPGTVEYEWTSDAEYSLGSLSGNITSFAADPHAADHITGGPDALQAAPRTATTQTALAINQSVIPTEQSSGTGVAVNNTTATNQMANASVAVDNTTAVNQNVTTIHHETFLAPNFLGANLGTIDEAVAVVDPSTQPNHPTTIRMTWDTFWEGGDVRIDGTGLDGQPVSEVIAENPGGQSFGVKAFMRINDPNGIVNLSPGGGGGDIAIVGVGPHIGLALVPDASTVGIIKVTVDSIPSSATTSSSANKTFEPQLAKDGARNYEVWYSAIHNHTQDTHSHTVTDGGHNHTQNTHNHGVTDPSHTHGQHAHNHTQNYHTHTQDPHTHDVEEP